MSSQRMAHVAENSVAGIVLILALVPVGICQTTSDQENAAASSDPQEEIIVCGEKSLRN